MHGLGASSYLAPIVHPGSQAGGTSAWGLLAECRSLKYVGLLLWRERSREQTLFFHRCNREVLVISSVHYNNLGIMVLFNPGSFLARVEHWQKEGGRLLLSSDNSWQTCFLLPVHIYSYFKGKHGHLFREKNNNKEWLKLWLNFLVFLKYTSVSEWAAGDEKSKSHQWQFGWAGEDCHLSCFLPLVDLL